MRLEEHPKALLAILVFALGAGVLGASRTMMEGPAPPRASGQAQTCRVEAPAPPVDFAALPAALAYAIENGALSLDSPATLALVRSLEASR